MTKVLLFIGNALLDISIHCDRQLLEKFHLKPDDNTEATSAQFGLFDAISNHANAIKTPGGSSQNSARVAQLILQKIGSGAVYFIGCVGKDAYAETLKEQLQLVGVKALYDSHESAPTGIVAGLVLEDGQRALCAHLGAAAHFSSEFLNEPVVKASLLSAEIIYIEGFFLSHSHSCAFQVAELALECGKMFALNLSGMYICKEHMQKVQKCIPYCDIIIGNRSEALTLFNLDDDFDNVLYSAKHLASLPHKKFNSRIVIITQGHDPVIVVQGTNEPQIYAVPFVAEVVDTIGCGDAFAGGFLACLLHGKSLDFAVKCGIFAAGEVAKHHGCTLPLHSIQLDEIGNNLDV